MLSGGWGRLGAAGGKGGGKRRRRVKTTLGPRHWIDWGGNRGAILNAHKKRFWFRFELKSSMFGLSHF